MSPTHFFGWPTGSDPSLPIVGVNRCRPLEAVETSQHVPWPGNVGGLPNKTRTSDFSGVYPPSLRRDDPPSTPPEAFSSEFKTPGETFQGGWTTIPFLIGSL